MATVMHETRGGPVWLFRGVLKENEAGGLVLVLGSSEPSRSEVDVDLAGRVFHDGRWCELSGVGFVCEKDPADGADAVRLAFEASVAAAHRRGLLPFLRAMIGECSPVRSEDGLVMFSPEPPRVPWTGGVVLSSPSASVRRDGIWRAGVREVVQVGTSTIVLTREDRLVILTGDSASVWCRLEGSPEDELAASLGFTSTRWNHAIRVLRELGLIATDAQWAPSDDAVCATSDEGDVYLSRCGSLAPPVVLAGWGAVIWSIVAETGPISSAQIVARIEKETDTLRDDIANDVEVFIADLGRRGFVRC